MKSVLEKLTTNADKKNNIAHPYLATMAKLGLYDEALHSPLITEELDREKVKGHIKFLSFYSENSEVLYEAALGTYNLNLTAVVSDCLNKDPKEYLPILNDLQSLSPEKRCFSIDNTLKKYPKAVRSLLFDPTVQHDEVLKYVERHRLFASALRIINEASEEELKIRGMENMDVLKKEVQISYGRWLENNGKVKEAGILYRRGGNIQKALDCCLKCVSWETGVSICYEENFKHEEFVAYCNKLRIVLEEREDYESAARLCEVHLKDSRLAIELWIRARKWLTAYSLAIKTNDLTTLVANLIKPKLIEHGKYYEEFLQNQQTDIEIYVQRLRAVKIRKAELEAAAAENGIGDHFSDSESVSTMSTTSSMKSGSTTSSMMSGKTHRSSKNRRKAERKIFSLKEGSRFEDIAITIHLWDKFTNIQQEIKPDVTHTIESLWRFEMDDMASALSISFDEFIKLTDEYVKEIWSAPLPENPMLDSKYRVAPAGWTISWDKLSFSSV
jgi:elongator complex protein 1